MLKHKSKDIFERFKCLTAELENIKNYNGAISRANVLRFCEATTREQDESNVSNIQVHGANFRLKLQYVPKRHLPGLLQQ